MDTPRAVLTTLAWRYAFGDLAALTMAGAVRDIDTGHVSALCAFGQGLLDLDAEDFGAPEPAGNGHAVPADLLVRARASRMPQAPRERPRGALTSLRPAYALLLEVLEARWRRREMAALVAVGHIAAEYLPLLAWEPVLGHAGDPARLARSVRGDRSLFGLPGDQDCAHSRQERSATERVLRVAGEPGPGWRAYLDRQHSHVARALGVCVARCRRPCSVALRLDAATRTALTERCQIALDFADSALVRLRHAAPVGHGFGVPSPEEVQDAWARTRTSLGKYRLAEDAFAAADAGSGPGVGAFPLAGLPELFSAVAAAPIVPDTLLREVAGRIASALHPASPAAAVPDPDGQHGTVETGVAEPRMPGPAARPGAARRAAAAPGTAQAGAGTGAGEPGRASPVPDAGDDTAPGS